MPILEKIIRGDYDYSGIDSSSYELRQREFDFAETLSLLQEERMKEEAARWYGIPAAIKDIRLGLQAFREKEEEIKPAPEIAPKAIEVPPAISPPPVPAISAEAEKRATSILDALSYENLGRDVMDWAAAQPPPIAKPEWPEEGILGKMPGILKATAKGIESTIPNFVLSLAGKQREDLEYLSYEPETLFEKVAMHAAQTGTFIGGAHIVSGGLKLIPFVGSKTLPFLRKGMVADSIKFIENRFPFASGLLTGKAGIETAIDNALRLGASFAIFNQTLLEQGTPLRERVKQVGQDFLFGALLTRMAGISNAALRTSAHGAFGYASALLAGEGELDDALISGAIWAAIGRVGGLQVSENALLRDLRNRALAESRKNPALRLHVEELDVAMKEMDVAVRISRAKVKEKERAKVVTAEKELPVEEKVNQELGVAIERVSKAAESLEEALSATRKNYTAALESQRYIEYLRNTRRISMKEILDDEFVADMRRFRQEAREDRLSKEIREIFEENSTTFFDVSDIAPRVSPEGKEIIPAVPLKRGQLTPQEMKGVIRVNLDRPEGTGSDFAVVKMRIFLEMLRKGNISEKFRASVEKEMENLRLHPGRAEQPAFVFRLSQAKELVRDYFKDAKELDSYVNKVVALLSEGSPRSLRQARSMTIEWKGPEAELSKVVEKLRGTEGREGDLVDAIIGVLGKDIPMDSRLARWRVANDAVPRWGYSNVKAMFSDIEGSFVKEFNSLRKNEAQKIVINHDVNSKIRNAVSRVVVTPKEAREMSEKTKRGEAVAEVDAEAPGAKVRPLKNIESELMIRLNAFLLDARTPPRVRGRAIGEEILIVKDKSNKVKLEEWSHLLDAKYNMTKNIAELSKTDGSFRAMENELIRKAIPEVKKNYPKEKWLVESYAKMIRDYLRGDNVWERFPQSFEYFKESIRQDNPAFWDTITQARNDIINYYKSPLSARMSADMYARNEGQWVKNLLKEAEEGLLAIKIKTLLRDTYEANFDVFRTLYRLDDSMGPNVRNDSSSVGMRAETLEPRINGFAEFLYRNGIPKDARDITHHMKHPRDIPVTTRGLYEIIEDIPISRIKDVAVYRVAKRFEAIHMKARKEGKRLVEGEDFPEGYSLREVREVIREKEASFPAVKEIAEEFRNFHGELRRVYKDIGELTEEQYKKMEETPYYTALMREGNFFSGDFRFNERMNETITKRYLGSAREDIVDPFLQDHTLVYGAARRVIMRDLLLRVVNIAEKKPSSLASIESLPPLRATKIEPQEILSLLKRRVDMSPAQERKLREQMEKESDLVSQIWRPFITNEPNIYRVQVEPGKFKYVRLDPKVADAIGVLDRSSAANAFVNLMRYTSTVVRQTATTFSPAFLVKNPLRDALASYIQADALFIPIWDSIKGLKSFIGKDRTYDMAMLYGLRYESLQMEGIKPAEALARVDMYGNVHGRASQFVNKWRNIAQSSEMMSRLGVLQKYNLNDTTQLMRGIRDAQRASYFWGKRGTKDSPLVEWNKIVAFLKANVIAFESQVRHLGRFRTWKRGLPLSFLSLLHSMAMEDNEDYWELPMWRRVTGINVPHPNKPGSFIMLPFLGDVYFMLFWALPNAMYGQAKKDSQEGSVKAWAREVIDRWSPSAFSRTGLIPNLLSPIVQSFMNTLTISGQKIIPERFRGLRKEAMITQKTSNFAILLSNGINNAWGSFTGGKELVSPIAIDFYFSQYLTGMYQAYVQASDAYAMWVGADLNWRRETMEDLDLPAISAFLRKELSPAAAYSVDRTMRRLERYAEFSNTFDAYKKVDVDKAMDFYSRYTWQVNMGYTSEDFQRVLRGEIANWYAIKELRGMTQAEKKVQLRRIRTSILRVSRQTEEVLDNYEEDYQRSKKELKESK